MFKASKRLFLISFMALTLLGVQLVQESPLHDHSQHGLDCVLCHFELSDDTTTSNRNILPSIEAPQVYHALVTQFATSQQRSPYKSRAPPYSFL